MSTKEIRDEYEMKQNYNMCNCCIYIMMFVSFVGIAIKFVATFL